MVKYFLFNPVSERIVAPVSESVPAVPKRLSRGLSGALPSATAISVPPVDRLIHLDFGQGGIEVNEVENTIPGELYDELFKR
jgi:hypothetical protein